ncbi:MAG: sel1 repeat family protein [Hyphomicrobiales bacterium]|jgi:TPR repeat protein|nr:sel1 repeat family protein [Hyphomicrobiales bacterium]
MRINRFVRRFVIRALLTFGLLTSQWQLAKAGPVEDGDRAFLQGHIEAAIQLWTPPATQGSAEAQYRLSQVYLSGNGVARDLELGLKWLSLAAERHYPPALIDLADLKLDPRNVMYQPDEAIDLLRDAAGQGVVQAQRQLGKLYREGKAVSQDFTESLHFYRIAAQRGDLESQYGLGELYRYGYGVEQNNIKALMWMSLAASAITGNKVELKNIAHQAAIARDQLSKLVGPSGRAEADQLASHCWQNKLATCD